MCVVAIAMDCTDVQSYGEFTAWVKLLKFLDALSACATTVFEGRIFSQNHFFLHNKGSGYYPRRRTNHTDLEPIWKVYKSFGGAKKELYSVIAISGC